MKKLILAAVLFSTVLIAPFALAQTAPVMTSVSIQNITTTGATISFTNGYDEIGALIANRQPMKLKYRAVAASEGISPQINGTETEIPLQYTIDSPNPVASVVLSNLKQNTKYAVWIGHQAIRTCLTDTPCVAIYTQYDSAPIVFSTKLDLSTVAELSKTLSFQEKSSDVLILKKYLSSNNYMQPSTTSTFDIPTLVGVIKFQIANNLTTDGVVGSASRNIINAWLISQAQVQ